MRNYKFKGLDKENNFTKSFTLDEIVHNEKINENDRNEFSRFKNCEKYVQYLGFHDNNNTEIYEGDILQIKITDELLNGFSNASKNFIQSEIGKYLLSNRHIDSILIVSSRLNNPTMSFYYSCYFTIDGKVETFKQCNDLKRFIWGEDSYFMKYLAKYGAVIIGNTLNNNKYNVK